MTFNCHDIVVDLFNKTTVANQTILEEFMCDKEHHSTGLSLEYLNGWFLWMTNLLPYKQKKSHGELKFKLERIWPGPPDQMLVCNFY